MFSFLESSWLWLLLGTLLIFLAGCVLIPRAIPQISMDEAPHLSPIRFFPFEIERLDLNDVLNPSYSLELAPRQISQQRQQSPNPDEDDYFSSSPSCYFSPNGSHICLGRLWNTSEISLASPEVELNFLNELGQIIHQEQAFSEQELILSDEFAPYRAITNFYEPFAAIEAETQPIHSLNEALRSVSIVDSRGRMNDETGRYRLTATIQNDVGEKVYNLRLFASLVDIEDRLVAYRIYEVGESLENGERQVVEVELIPMIMPEAVSHHLFVEASLEDE